MSKRWGYIMRGVAGCGKSLMAKGIVDMHGGVIHTTDSYHMENGKYIYKPEKAPEFHAKNLEAFEESCKKGIEVVICDNTNILPSQFIPYVRVIKKYKYSLRIITLTGGTPEEYHNNTGHVVPEDVIDRMYVDMAAINETSTYSLIKG